MDRRYKDYYIVTFKRHRDHYSWGGGYLTSEFCHFPRGVKVHWKSADCIPYALVSVDKGLPADIFKNVFGVDKCIPFTEQKERDLEVWNKILHIPHYDYCVKSKVEKCKQQDLFIDWSEVE